MKKVILSILVCFGLTGCDTTFMDMLTTADDVAVKYTEFDKNLTGPITGNVYQLHKEKGQHIKVKVE